MNGFQEVDQAILLRLQWGDEQAFRVIYDCYCTRLYSFSYKFLRDAAQSEEVVQETLLKLWENRKSIAADVPIGPYLFTIAKRLSLNVMRHAKYVDQLYDQVNRKNRIGHNDTEEGILFNDLSVFAESVIIDLPTKQQEVFRLSRHHGLSHKQIAKQLALSENTVRNHISAALKKLQVSFDKYYVLYLFIFSFLS